MTFQDELKQLMDSIHQYTMGTPLQQQEAVRLTERLKSLSAQIDSSADPGLIAKNAMSAGMAFGWLIYSEYTDPIRARQVEILAEGREKKHKDEKEPLADRDQTIKKFVEDNLNLDPKTIATRLLMAGLEPPLSYETLRKRASKLKKESARG
jgi:hypothetical protein